MNVLLLGSGGREHALAWRLAQSPGLAPGLGTLWAAPGNPGIAEHARLAPLDPADHDAVIGFARANGVALVVIGPEAPLVAGLGDALRAEGIAVFGPGRDAARLEGSKGFTKDLCRDFAIPTARYARVGSPAEAAVALDAFGAPVVVKADGLAAGKGVTVAATRAQADAAVEAIFGPDARGAGEAVIEEFLQGEEASLFALSDGHVVMPFGSAEDHKRVGEGDTGPNTGGMGAVSPSGALTAALERQAMDEIVRPTVAALLAAGTPYVGVLYAGLMLTADGPKLIEYNARFGDPEAQALMMRYRGDLLALLHATATGRLAEAPTPVLAEDAAVTVVLAARGYPGEPVAGGTIAALAAAEAGGARVFQAGTRARGDALVAAGGRVLAVTAAAATLADARDAAYRAVDRIDFSDGFCRRDIGARALARAGQDRGAA